MSSGYHFCLTFSNDAREISEKATLDCLECEVGYCDACYRKRHRKGAFTRHT